MKCIKCGATLTPEREAEIIYETSAQLYAPLVICDACIDKDWGNTLWAGEEEADEEEADEEDLLP